MIPKNEMQIRIAETLKELRLKKGYSKSRIANELFIDDKTWARYESGKSSPTVPEFLWIFSKLGENALRSVLNIVYPCTYGDITPDSDIRDLRTAASHYFQNVASDKTVREWDFITFGEHGSNFEAQIQLFTLIDHLPLEYRVVIATSALAMWEMCVNSSHIHCDNNVLPDVKLIEDGIIKAKLSLQDGAKGYSATVD